MFRPGLTWREMVRLFRRPEPLPASTIRMCWRRNCNQPALAGELQCEPHEKAQRLEMYDRVEGWGVR